MKMGSRGRPLLISALAVAAVVSGFGVQPVLGASPVTVAAAAEPDDGGAPPSRPDQASALAAAKASGERVVIAPETDVDRQVFAETDGSLTAEVNSGPARAKNSAGDWAPINTDLIESNGRLVPKNVPGDLSLSAGGDHAFAKADAAGDGTAQDLVWQWPTELPEPVVDGPTATYPDAVAGGGDLVVIATPSGFTHNVVLHEPPAAGAGPLHLTVPVTTPGSELRETSNGALEVKDNSTGTKVATAPVPLMWDASGTDDTDPAIETVNASVVDTQAGSKLVLTPDQDFLADPDTVYPVTIDPSFTVGPYTIADTWADNSTYSMSQSTSGELRVGTTNSGTTKARSFLKFDDTSWNGSTINSATLTLRNFASGSCTASSIQAARITEAWNSVNVTWANQPSATTNDQAYYAPAAGADGCPSANATWDAKAIVTTWARTSTNSNFGIRLAAVNEASNNTYRRYRSAEYTDYDGNFRPKLTVNYTPPPDVTAPLAPQVTSLNVTDGAYIDPLPPAHAFDLKSEDPEVAKFLVSRDGAAAEPVTASAGRASYPWSPGFGWHTLSVIAQDPSGNSSDPKEIRFSVREFNELATAVVLAELTLAPDETRSTDVAELPGVSWDDVDTIVGTLEARGWTTGQSGSVTISTGDGTFPAQPSLTWSTTQDPGAGAGSNVVAELNQQGQLELRNTSSSSVSVKLTATGWWRFDPTTGDDEESTEDELEQVDEPGSSGDGDLTESGNTQTCSATEDPEIFYCLSDGNTEGAPTAMKSASPTGAAASSGQPWPNTPNCDDETGSRNGWTTYRFRACNYTFKTGKMYLVSRSGVKKIGEWDFGVFQTVWVGHLTRKIVTEVEIKLWETRGSVKSAALTPTVIFDCNPLYLCGLEHERRTMHPLALIPYQEQMWSDSVTFATDISLPYADYHDDARIYTSASWLAVPVAPYVPGESNVGTFPRSNLIRCDNHPYFNQSPGCRFVAAEPTFVLKRKGEGVDEAAAWYKYFQDNIYAWATDSTNWFTRAEPWERRKNRRRACSGFVKSAPSKSCDEFPFAVTRQGCWTSGLRWMSCKPGDVDLDHNQLAGSKLGAFLRRNRILRSAPDEQFYVRIK